MLQEGKCKKWNVIRETAKTYLVEFWYPKLNSTITYIIDHKGPSDRVMT